MTSLRSVRDFLSSNGRKAQFGLRRISPGPRALPHFMVIGAQKSGTSSMFAYLKQHPQVVRPIFKEIYYFDRNYARGLGWYGCNFVSRAELERMNDRAGRPHLTFEATATYIFDPLTPERIARDTGTRKFIALLRNPADRAISAYWHARRMGIETRPLLDAMRADRERYDAEIALESWQAPASSAPIQRSRYLRRGIYLEAISRWHKTFRPEDMLILQSEAMFADPATVMTRVFAFLGVEPVANLDFEPQNVGQYKDADAAVRDELRAFYRPHNDAFRNLCGMQADW